MASWKEISRVRKHPVEFRAIASRILATNEIDLTEWEMVFLEEATKKLNVTEFTTAQAEKLLQIRDDTEIVRTWRGFSVELLLKNCYEARCDLIESDEEWIIAIREAMRDGIRRRNLGRLARIASRLGVIEEDGDL